MIDSVHFFSENNNRITVNTILVYILKRTRLTPKMTQLITGPLEGGWLFDMKIEVAICFCEPIMSRKKVKVKC